jgi:antitoxin (DNA-binding transcriptional repressor) of toxin-antitoxin stability system
MTKDISVQEMQEHFADHIEEVRNGVTLRLIDGDKFVAEISPLARRATTTPEDMIYRHAHGRWLTSFRHLPSSQTLMSLRFFAKTETLVESVRRKRELKP